MASPSGHAAEPITGIGEQHPEIFSDPWWEGLGLHRIRYVVAWDFMHSAQQLAETDAYLAAAHAAGAQVLLSFGALAGELAPEGTA